MYYKAFLPEKLYIVSLWSQLGWNNEYVNVCPWLYVQTFWMKYTGKPLQLSVKSPDVGVPLVSSSIGSMTYNWY